MQDKLAYVKNLFARDRVVLALILMIFAAIVVFLENIGSAHGLNCTYRALHSSELAMEAFFMLVAIMASYVLGRLALHGKGSPSNAQIIGVIIQTGAVFVLTAAVYVIVGFGLFFGHHC
jgi:hypothetical protein